MHAVVYEDLAAQVMAELPPEGRRATLALLKIVQQAPDAWPDVAEPGAAEEMREAYGPLSWVQYTPRAGAIEVRDIGWAG